MANDLTLTCQLNKASLPVMSTQQLVYVLIEAVPGAGMARVQVPLNLSLVLDKSGSMQGRKSRICGRRPSFVARQPCGRMLPSIFIRCRSDSHAWRPAKPDFSPNNSPRRTRRARRLLKDRFSVRDKHTRHPGHLVARMQDAKTSSQVFPPRTPCPPW